MGSAVALLIPHAHLALIDGRVLRSEELDGERGRGGTFDPVVIDEIDGVAGPLVAQDSGWCGGGGFQREGGTFIDEGCARLLSDDAKRDGGRDDGGGGVGEVLV